MRMMTMKMLKENPILRLSGLFFDFFFEKCVFVIVHHGIRRTVRSSTCDALISPKEKNYLLFTYS